MLIHIALKRRIPIKSILGITVSSITDEFIIHGTNNEYDYHFVSHKRYLILGVINDCYHDLENKNLKISEIKEKTLKNYVTNRIEKKEQPNLTKMNLSSAYEIEKYFACHSDKHQTKNISNDETQQNNVKNHPETKLIRTNTFFSSHKIIKKVSLEEFKIIKVIGRGSFGKVCLVEYLPTNELYAMKSLKKDVLIEQGQIENTIIEKKILESVNYPFLCNLVFCFQTQERVYLILPYMPGGELFQHLRMSKIFDEPRVKFYGAQIALALQYLHDKNVVYRDLKPENVLMDENGYLKLADFGMAKVLKENEKSNSFCGTPEYLAPEIIFGNGHDRMADWWSFGIMIFEMLCGIPPFYNENIEYMYQLIKQASIKFPKCLNLSEDAKNLILRLLVVNPKQRLGAQSGLSEIKKHNFFAAIDFDRLEKKLIPAPFVPKISFDTDTQNFDEEFTNEDTRMTFIGKKNMEMINSNQEKFEEFGK